MAELTLWGRPVATVYELLGRKENDITFAVGWGLAQSNNLLARFLEAVEATEDDLAAVQIDLQRQEPSSGLEGFTDIELLSPRSHVIVEAKRGWGLPTLEQLGLYRARLEHSQRDDSRFVILTQWGEAAHVKRTLGKALGQHPIMTLGLGQLTELALDVARRSRSPSERRLVRELATYLKGVASMRDLHSNSVYVVSLTTKESWEVPGLTNAEIVEQRRLYWYPAGDTGGWPKTPPNYVGFRYRGKLQSIHYIEDYIISSNLAEDVEGAVETDDRLRFVFSLGPPITPAHEVRTGSRIFRSMRVWVDIDLLLTEPTISDALEKTRARHELPS
jgi:hypothetical protein